MGFATVTSGFAVPRVSHRHEGFAVRGARHRPWGSPPSGGFATLNGSTKIVTILLSEKCHYLAEHLIPDLGVHEKG